ncbi:hypothetical protein GWK47_036866 [Chionoecetes opilio]|uniref:Endonuclease/exonuclease/phosphatase domain-containing protein n=1 Tax=Chionoecetes opilio TaxID=41210 RepID=A0A8J4YR34_CHIOP|nr:hypothetical protein GWK47_036866 [Chionoecetes opilio]
MCGLAQERDASARLVLLDPAERHTKTVFQRYPLDMPLEAVRDHPALSRRGASVPSVTGPRPVSQAHASEQCIRCHKARQLTTARCPNCFGGHHAWNPRCPERLRRLPGEGRRLQGGGDRPGPQGSFAPFPLPTRPTWVGAGALDTDAEGSRGLASLRHIPDTRLSRVSVDHDRPTKRQRRRWKAQARAQHSLGQEVAGPHPSPTPATLSPPTPVSPVPTPSAAIPSPTPAPVSPTMAPTPAGPIASTPPAVMPTPAPASPVHSTATPTATSTLSQPGVTPAASPGPMTSTPGLLSGLYSGGLLGTLRCVVGVMKRLLARSDDVPRDEGELEAFLWAEMARDLRRSSPPSLAHDRPSSPPSLLPSTSTTLPFPGLLTEETLTPEHFEWRIAGYTVHSLSCGEDGRRGCVVVVRSALPHRRIEDPVHCGEGVEVMAVQLELPALPLTVHNVYSSWRRQLEADELLSLATHISVLVGGDFNAHHPMLQSVSPTNRAGRHLAAVLEEVPEIVLLNTGEPTHVRGGRLDLTLISSDLAPAASWQVHPTLTSDHYAVATTLQVTRPLTQLPTPRWNIQRADWALFQAILDEWWATYEPLEDLDQRESDLTAAIERAAEAAIPRKVPGRRYNQNWWFYNQEVREQNHMVNIHWKLYRRQPTPTNLKLLCEVVRQVGRVQEAKWLEWCAGFNQHTKLAELWGKVRTASSERDLPALPPTPSRYRRPSARWGCLPRGVAATNSPPVSSGCRFGSNLCVRLSSAPLALAPTPLISPSLPRSW